MIAIADQRPQPKRQSNWQTGFRAMTPDIIRHVKQAFRYLDAEARSEAIQEAIVATMVAYIRLYDCGKLDVAYPSVLARFAVAQFHDGRRVSAKLNCRDVMSPYARRKKGIQVDSLHGYDQVDHTWHEILVEDKHAGPAETAAARLDFSDWFNSLTRRDQLIAEALSGGDTTKDVARRFDVSPGRISQKRRQFLESWQRFHGEHEGRQ